MTCQQKRQIVADVSTLLSDAVRIGRLTVNGHAFASKAEKDRWADAYGRATAAGWLRESRDRTRFDVWLYDITPLGREQARQAAAQTATAATAEMAGEVGAK